MARDDSDDIRIRPGRSRRAGTRADPRELPFTRQVELAVRMAGGNPGRIGGRKGGGSGRFNAHGRGAKAGRFRSRRVVVKAGIPGTQYSIPRTEPKFRNSGDIEILGT